MTLPKRIILSRKGFDLSAGKCASPILPDGTMFSIPVPENSGHVVATSYEHLGRQGQVPLPTRLITSSRRAISLTGQVHLDPDIRPELRPEHARNNCSPGLLLYGQNDGFQTHLTNEGVREGDLFLFFGWFRKAEWIGRDLRFVRGARNGHVIWGWLQIERRHFVSRNGPVPEVLRTAQHHPHLDYLDRQTNCVYEAGETLSFSPEHGGAGIFNPYSHELCLTAPNELRRSHWALPDFFQRTNVTHLYWDKWIKNGDHIRGQIPGRGQEFVFNTEPIENEVKPWLANLFQHAEKRN
jgi:Nucleotide modification associated domain 3